MRSYLLATSILVLGLSACGEKVGQLRVGDEPEEISLRVEAGAKLVFWTEVEVQTGEANQYSYTSDLPRVVDYEIEVLYDGETLHELVCSPFATNVFSFKSSLGAEPRHYLGKIDGCSVTLSQANVTIRARRRWQKDRSEIRLLSSELIVKI